VIKGQDKAVKRRGFKHRYLKVFRGEGVSDPLCLYTSSALNFSHYSFLVHHPVNRDDRQLLTWLEFKTYLDIYGLKGDPSRSLKH
jgi:hypothetical protein